MKYIRNFNSLNSAKAATLYSPAVTLITENGQSALLNKDLGSKDQTIKITGSSLDDLEFKCLITGEWTYKSANKDKILIKGEVTLNSKVDCYSIEFLSGGHLTINADARLRIWEGGIVNNDCSTVNYFTILTTNGTSYSITGGELLLHPNVTTNINPKATVNLYTTVKSGTWQHIAIPTLVKPAIGVDPSSPSGAQTGYFNIWDRTEGWKTISISEFKNPFIGYNFSNGATAIGAIYTLTGNIIINENHVVTTNGEGYTLFANSYPCKIPTRKLLQLFESNIMLMQNDVQDFVEITSENVNNYKYIYSYVGFMIHSSTLRSFTLNYKDLVWDPSFEDDEEAVATPLLTTGASPLLASSTENTINSQIFANPDTNNAISL